MKTGRIVTYFESKGFGFIHEYLGEGKKFRQWFFHISSCLCEPSVRLEVQFEIGEGKKGPMAIDVDAFQPASEITALDVLVGKTSTEVNQ